jgi:hypothetical protein
LIPFPSFDSLPTITTIIIIIIVIITTTIITIIINSVMWKR